MIPRRYLAQIARVVLALLILSSLLPPPASASSPGAPPAPEIIRIQPPLTYRGHTYTVDYLATGSYRRATTHLFFGAETADFFRKNGITGMEVRRDGQLVSDADELRTVFLLYNAAHILYIYQPQGLWHVPDDFAKDLQKVTENPVFIEQYLKGRFKSRTDEVTETMRSICSPQLKQDDAEQLADALRGGLQADKDILTAVDDAVQALRLSRAAGMRARRAALGQAFSGWRKVDEQGKLYLKLGKGARVELADGLELLELGTKLIWTADVAKERAEWLAQYEGAFHQGPQALDDAQRAAVTKAGREAEQTWQQRVDIVVSAAQDKFWDTAVKLGAKGVAKGVVAIIKRLPISQHALDFSSGIACLTLGLTLGNILYGLDDLSHNFRVAERSEELRLRFKAGRLDLQNRAKAADKRTYDGDMAEVYRAAYMLESLAAAQCNRSYADGLDAAVNKSIIDWINPVNWATMFRWKTIPRFFRQFANEDEKTADNYVGHPPFVDAAIELAQKGIPDLPVPPTPITPRPQPGSEAVAAVRAFFAAVEKSDAAAAAGQMHPKLGWLARPALDLTFSALRESRVSVVFQGLKYEYVETALDRGIVRVQGQVTLTNAADGTSESDTFAVDVPTSRFLGRWYIDVDVSELEKLIPKE